jgi:hypothetical protein
MKEVFTLPQNNSTDVGIECIAWKFGTGQGFSITVTDDWYGDSETGFGASVSCSFDRKQAEEFRDFLTKWLTTKGEV